MSKIILILSFVVATHGAYLGCTSDGMNCAYQTGEDLRHPEQQLSRHNLLETELKVEISKIRFGGWLELSRRTYEGNIGGPTWRVNPGDVIDVTLVNNLKSDGTGEGSMNSLRNPNSTNLYLHGLHISPKDNDASVHVAPGQSKSYSYKIGCEHPSGTYWYHPHYHGSAMFQTLSGMAGMIVVEDPVSAPNDPTSISFYSCPENCNREVELFFQPTLLYKIQENGFSFARIQRKIGDRFRNRTMEDWLMRRQNQVSLFTTNGQIEPTVRLEAGKTMRFRMVNAGGIHVLEIEVPSSCRVHEIARDGVYLARPLTPANGKSVLPQGGTMDWLIRCDTTGKFEIRSSPDTRGRSGIGRADRYEGTLVRLEVINGTTRLNSVDDDVAISLPAAPSFMADLLGPSHVTGRFVLETCVNNILNRRKYDETVAYEMPLDGVEEWSLLNTDPSNSHTIFVQGNHFQIIRYNEYSGPISIATERGVIFVDKKSRLCQDTKPTPSVITLKKAGVSRSDYRSFQGVGPAPVGQWRNTIILPPLSNVTVRLLATHFEGKTIVFSHNLLRDDFGMKIVVQIVGKGNRSRIVASTERLPGTCRSGDFYPEPQSRKFGKDHFESFFSWMYRLKPQYKRKFGDQRYLSSIYSVFLSQYHKPTPDGSHMTDFFLWAYDKFPAYKSFYGDQSYLTELYDYYLATHQDEQTDRRSN